MARVGTHPCLVSGVMAGGVIYIECDELIFDGTLTADGANGDIGDPAGSGGGGGGGFGGGGGGSIPSWQSDTVQGTPGGAIDLGIVLLDAENSSDADDPGAGERRQEFVIRGEIRQ